MADKVTKEVDVKIATPGAEQAKQSLSGLAAKLKEVRDAGKGAELSGLGKQLRDLNNAGKGAGLTGDSGLIGLLKGGGALAAVNFLAQGITIAASAWKDYEAGAISAREATVAVAKAIPVIGSVFEATFAIADAFSNRLEIVAEVAKYQGVWNNFVKESQVQGKRIESVRDSLPALAGHNRNTSPELTALVKNKKFLDQQRESYETGNLVLTEPQKEALYSGIKEHDEEISEMQKRVATGIGSLGISLKEGLESAAKKHAEDFKDKIEAARVDEINKRIEWDVGMMNLRRERREEDEDILDGWLMGKGTRPAEASPILNRSTPAVEGRFLTGAAPTDYGGPPPDINGEKTARGVETTNKLLQETLAALRDIGRALREGGAPSNVILLK